MALTRPRSIANLSPTVYRSVVTYASGAHAEGADSSPALVTTNLPSSERSNVPSLFLLSEGSSTIPLTLRYEPHIDTIVAAVEGDRSTHVQDAERGLNHSTFLDHDQFVREFHHSAVPSD